MADRDGAVRDQQSMEEEEEGTETERPGAAGAALDLRWDSRPERLQNEKHSPLTRYLLGWEARRRRASRRARMAAPRGRAQQKVRVGPGLGVTHRRPGRYTAAMAPSLGLRGAHENGTELGRYGRQGRRERGEARRS